MRERLVTVSDPACELVCFMQADGSAEAVILRGEWKEASRIKIAKPPEGFRIAMVCYPGGSRELVYREEADVLSR